MSATPAQRDVIANCFRAAFIEEYELSGDEGRADRAAHAAVAALVAAQERPAQAPEAVAEPTSSGAGSLPLDWKTRLARDPILAKHWTMSEPLRGPDQSASAYALALANRLIREYPGDTDPQRLAVLAAFYRAPGREKPREALQLTLAAAKDGATGNAERDGRSNGVSASSASGAIITCVADVKPEPTSWIWPGRIPLGKQTNFVGDPGIGKSTIALDIAARVSTGRELPDGTRGDLYGKPSGVVIISVEDDQATIRARLEAAGADLRRIVILEGVQLPKNGVRLPTLWDVAQIREAVQRVHAKLVIADPLTAFFPDKCNSYKDQDVRQAVGPLCKLAMEMAFTLFVIGHLTKPGESVESVKAIYRAGGSIAIAANARSVVLAAKDGSDPDGKRCVLAHVKSNLGPLAPALSYQAEEVRVDEADGKPITAVRIKWGDPVDATADDLVGAMVHDVEEPSRLKEAGDFLREQLADGPIPSGDLIARASASGISEKTLRRAKQQLAAGHKKLGMRGPWVWFLPGDSKQGAA